jgi:hypothetical protein
MNQTARKYSTQEKVALMQVACKRDLRFLCEDLLGMDKWEPSLHDDLARFLAKDSRRKMILMPRGHLKSSIVTVGWAIQRLLANPNIRILIASAVWNNAREFLRQIQGFLTDRSLLPKLFGPFMNSKTRWTADDLDIAQRTDFTKRGATISTAGIEGSKTGMHYDLIIADDLVVRENVSTPDQIQKVITFYRDLLDLLDPGGELVLIGTRWTLGDLYGWVMENEMASLNGHVFKTPEERMDWRKVAPQ